MRRKKDDILHRAGPFNIFLLSLITAFAGQFFLYRKISIAAGLILMLLAVIVFILADKAASPGKSIFDSYPLKEKDNSGKGISIKREAIIFTVIIIL